MGNKFNVIHDVIPAKAGIQVSREWPRFPIRSGMTIILSLTLFLSVSFPALAFEAGASAVTQNITKDNRVEKLRAFLESYNSPLSDFAPVFVKTADKYGLDWKLVPSISGVESTFGKAIPEGSYNAYGWSNGEAEFSSWEESIDTVTKSLRQNYINRGLTNVDLIAPIYCPPSNVWGNHVKFFMNKLENFSPKSTLALELSL